MRHETILKREDGTKISIEVTLWVDMRHDATWRIQVSKCPPRKRTYTYVNNTDDYTWRKLTIPEREKATMAEYLKHVTAEEILAAKIDLWNALKPTI
jgi:hypothetical protein